MKKRIWISSIAIVALGLVLTGCGSQQSSQQKTLNVTATQSIATADPNKADDIKIVSKGFVDGENNYHRPRVDFDLLEQYHEGLIATTACIEGQVPQAVLNFFRFWKQGLN